MAAEASRSRRTANMMRTEKRALRRAPVVTRARALGFLLITPWLAIAAAGVVAQSSAPGTPIIDNARVAVFDMKVPNAVKRLGRVDADVVVISLGGNGAAVGAVTFEPRGAAEVKGLEHSAGPRAMVVELKDAQVPPLKNTSGFPNAFPRPGAKQLLDNARVFVWDYSWTPGVPTPMHFHDKDVVVVYLADGALESTTPDGQSVVNPHYFGFTKYNPRDRAHTEKLVKGSGRAVIVELK